MTHTNYSPWHKPFSASTVYSSSIDFSRPIGLGYKQYPGQHCELYSVIKPRIWHINAHCPQICSVKTLEVIQTIENFDKSRLCLSNDWIYTESSISFPSKSCALSFLTGGNKYHLWRITVTWIRLLLVTCGFVSPSIQTENLGTDKGTRWPHTGRPSIGFDKSSISSSKHNKLFSLEICQYLKWGKSERFEWLKVTS